MHWISLFYAHDKFEDTCFSWKPAHEIKFVKAAWPAITSIALNINFLTTIKLSGLSRVSGKVNVLVRDNPCDAELCWLSRCQYKMARNEGFLFKCRGSEMIEMIGDMECNSPGERRNVTINESGKKSYGINAHKIFVCPVTLWSVDATEHSRSFWSPNLVYKHLSTVGYNELQTFVSIGILVLCPPSSILPNDL